MVRHSDGTEEVPRADDTNAPKDEDLVSRAKRGEQHAFRLLVERYQRRAYALALGVLRNEDDAKDAVQEAFVKAYRNLDRFAGQSSFYTWLYRIVMNAAIDQVRHRRRGGQTMSSYDDRIGHDTEEAGAETGTLSRLQDANPAKNLGRRELVEQMDKALEQLSSVHRAVLLMREVEGMSYSEMARTMRCSTGTIMSRLFHARRRMQVAMEAYLGGSDLKVFE